MFVKIISRSQHLNMNKTFSDNESLLFMKVCGFVPKVKS